jgi:type II secretory pathway pseudopilin PulG
MALSPLDLQTLFTQMDKVGRQEAAQREGAAILQSIQQARNQQQTDEKVRSVNEAQNTGDGTESIHDKNGGRAGQDGRRHNHTAGNDEEKAEEESKIIRDPDLGMNLDVSL